MDNLVALIQIKEFKKFLDIEKERQLATQELSEILGIDISLSDAEVMRNAEERFAKAYSKAIRKEVNSWMKSAFS
jgi:DNA-binding ferritin-like protein (Dps family)